MNLFHNLFNEKFESIRLEKGTLLIGALHEQIPLQKINSYLKNYTYFANDTLLELFFLKGINETYNKKKCPQKIPLKITGTLYTKRRLPRNKKYSHNGSIPLTKS